MKTLFLLRHAKSSWNDPMLDDFDRPLNPRGLRSAPVMGEYMKSKGYAPDLVLCSSARRTLETLSLIKPFIGLDLPTRIEDGLYLASADSIIMRAREIDDRFAAVLWIGHNPGLEDAVLLLTTRKGENTQQTQVMPTAALAMLTMDVASWRDVGEGTARLSDFSAPRGLSDG